MIAAIPTKSDCLILMLNRNIAVSASKEDKIQALNNILFSVMCRIWSEKTPFPGDCV